MSFEIHSVKVAACSKSHRVLVIGICMFIPHHYTFSFTNTVISPLSFFRIRSEMFENNIGIWIITPLFVGITS